MTVSEFTTGSGVQVTRIKNDVVSANTYVLRATGPHGDVCFVVDPGSDQQTLAAVLGGDDDPLVLLTHGHFDHVLGVPALQEKGSEVFMAAADRPFLRRNNFYMRALSVGHSTRPFEFRDLAEGAPDVPGLTVSATPGHSPGSYVFRFRDVLMTGDTILSRHILSPTIAGCNEGLQVLSVEGLIEEFTEDTVVLPGHGRTADVNDLLLRNDDLRTIVEYIRGHGEE